MAGIHGRTKRLGSGSMGRAAGPGRAKPFTKEKPFTKSKRFDQAEWIETGPDLLDHLIAVHGRARALSIMGYLSAANRDYGRTTAKMTPGGLSVMKSDLRDAGITPPVLVKVLGMSPASASRLVESRMGRPRVRPLKTG